MLFIIDTPEYLSGEIENLTYGIFAEIGQASSNKSVNAVITAAKDALKRAEEVQLLGLEKEEE